MYDGGLVKITASADPARTSGVGATSLDVSLGVVVAAAGAVVVWSVVSAWSAVVSVVG